jgi:hypothetical protein
MYRRRKRLSGIYPYAKRAMLAAAAAAPAIGLAAGGAPGAAAGVIASQIPRILGLGAYNVKHNVLLDPASNVPMFSNDPLTGGLNVTYSEYITDVISSSSANTFNKETYALNPGASNVFEFLAQIACNYDQYRWNGVIFQYRPTSGEALNSTNTALGVVTIATQYNVYDTVYANLGEMQASQFVTTCKPSDTCMHPIECDPTQTPLPQMYVNNNGAIPTGADQRLYNLCNTTVATSGVQGLSVNLGQLWVSYSVCLYKPKLFASLGYSIDSAVFWLTGYTSIDIYGTATARYKGKNNMQNCTISRPAANYIRLTLPSYPMTTMYEVYVYTSGTAAAVTQPALSYSGYGITNVNIGASSSDWVCPPSGVSTGTSSFKRMVVIPGGIPQGNAWVEANYTAATVHTAGNPDWICHVTQVNPSWSQTYGNAYTAL